MKKSDEKDRYGRPIQYSGGLNVQTYLDGQPTLTAKRDFGYTIEPVDLSDIINHNNTNMMDSIMELFKGGNRPPRSPRFYYLCYQIKMNGFIYNPLPLHRIDNTIHYVGGMLRLNACVELGYTSIDSIVLDNMGEIKDLIKQQQMSTREYFPYELLEPGTEKIEGLQNETN